MVITAIGGLMAEGELDETMAAMIEHEMYKAIDRALAQLRYELPGVTFNRADNIVVEFEEGEEAIAV